MRMRGRIRCWYKQGETGASEMLSVLELVQAGRNRRVRNAKRPGAGTSRESWRVGNAKRLRAESRDVALLDRDG